MPANTLVIVPPFLELNEIEVSAISLPGTPVFNTLQGLDAIQVGGAQFISHDVMSVVSVSHTNDPDSYLNPKNVQLAYKYHLPAPSYAPSQETTDQGICWLIWKHPLTNAELVRVNKDFVRARSV